MGPLSYDWLLDLNLTMTDSQSSDGTFYPSSQSESSPCRQSPQELAELHKDRVRLILMNDHNQALALLQSIDDGWCSIVPLAPSKADGYVQVCFMGSNCYVQVSFMGANKFACLREVVLWGAGVWLEVGQQASHLCGMPRCKALGHVIAETKIENQRRKGCRVWIDCPHEGCQLKILLCDHYPKCIRHVNGYDGQEDFLARGIHT